MQSRTAMLRGDARRKGAKAEVSRGKGKGEVEMLQGEK
jgi:hypothetical protein